MNEKQLTRLTMSEFAVRGSSEIFTRKYQLKDSIFFFFKKKIICLAIMKYTA